jgi:hypothetical protein
MWTNNYVKLLFCVKSVANSDQVFYLTGIKRLISGLFDDFDDIVFVFQKFSSIASIPTKSFVYW